MLVPVARSLVEELLVSQGELRTSAVRSDINGHKRFAFRRRAPCPGEHELPVGHDFAINAAYVMLLPVGAAHD